MGNDIVFTAAKDDTYYRDVKALFRDAFPGFCRNDIIKSWSWRDKKYSHVVYSKKDRRIIGFILVQDAGPFKLYVSYMAVHREDRGAGIGAIIIKHVLKMAEKKGKSVNLVSLKGVIAFYRSLGFYETGKEYTMNFHPYSTRSKPL
jgi:ribosomal protein S18 acetylase RimI-like enzyme